MKRKQVKQSVKKTVKAKAPSRPLRIARTPVVTPEPPAPTPEPSPTSLGRRATDAWIALVAPGDWERKRQVIDEVARLLDSQGYAEADPTERLLIDRLAVASLQVNHAEASLAATMGRDEAAARRWSALQQHCGNMLFAATKSLATYRKLAGIRRVAPQVAPPPPSELAQFMSGFASDLRIEDDGDLEAEMLVQRGFKSGPW